MRIIVHIDMNAFFAAVEQVRVPRLRGKPVAVVGTGRRTVVTTCSYEARRYGVRTGQTAPEARRHCPSLDLITGDPRRYTDICTRLNILYGTYAHAVEVFSIDESFLDVTGACRTWQEAGQLVLRIKRDIFRQFGLRCSAGIAPNKVLAKLGSDLRKPDGLVIIRPEEVSLLMENLPVESLCGIGRAMTQSLQEMGLVTVGQLAAYPPASLKARFGVIGQYLSFLARGEDDSPVVTLDETPEDKSVGHSTTIDHDVADPEEMERILLELAFRVGARMRRGHCTGRTVALTLRYTDFTTFSRRRSVGEQLYNSTDIFLVARDILRSLYLKGPVRLFGISVSNLAHDVLQLPLFRRDRQHMALTGCTDAINEKFGENTVLPAELLRQRRTGGAISPAWKPAGMKRVEF